MNRLIKTIAVIAMLAIPLAREAQGAVGTILFVVVNSASLTTQETAKRTLMQGWGYTVTPISASASQATFDASCLTSSMAYIGSEVTSTTLASKLVGTTIPVVNEVLDQGITLGFSTGTKSGLSSSFTVTNATHYITSTFALGSLTIFGSSQNMTYLNGTHGGITSLGDRSSGKPALAVLERGNALQPSGSAAGRRVFLPWGDVGLDINQLNSQGQKLMQRSIEWALMPLAWYKLDDASGITAVDSSGNGYTGTLMGPTWTTGKKAGGLNFNGFNDYVSIADAVAFDVTNALTVAGWIKCTGAWNTGSTVDVVLRKGDSNPNNWQLSVSDGRVELGLDMNDEAGIRGNTVLALNRWYHVAGTWDGTNGRVYVDGVQDNTPTAKAAPIGTDARAVYLGGRIGSTDVHTGPVDEVRFYNRCLTAAEIANLAKANPAVKTWTQVAP